MQPGDTFLAMDLAAGGHLTHGARPNLSGKWFRPVHYGVRQQDQRLDYDAVEELANEHKPKLIIAGGSAIPRQIDFARFRRDRRRGRRLPDGRHGPLRRPRRRRPAPEPGAARPRRHHHHPQDPARPARRHDPDQRRVDREEDQRGDLPRPAGRPADARHRRQGRRLRRGAAPGVPRLRRRGGEERAGPRRHADEGRPRHRHRRHRHPPDAGRPAPQGRHRQGHRDRPRPRQHHLQQERRPLRPAAAGDHLGRPPRHPRRHHPRLRRA